MNKNEFYPSRLSLNLWWGLAWRTFLFTLLLLAIESFLLGIGSRFLMQVNLPAVIRFMLWNQAHPLLSLVLGQVVVLIFAVLPALVLSWWMMLSAPVYRTYTLRHIRTMSSSRADDVAHGFCGAARMAWSSFWRVMLNTLPILAAMVALHAYQIHLALTTLQDLPGLGLVLAALSLVGLYLSMLTLQDLLQKPRRHWLLEARPHRWQELLSAFVPSAVAADAEETSAV